MKTFELYRILRKHRLLADKRNPAFSQNKAAKIWMYVITAFVAIYLIMFAIMFATIANSDSSVTAIELIFVFSPFIFAIDVLVRFIAQQTPAQLIRPYVLLPLPRYACIDCFIANSLFSWGNVLWFIMLVPYALMAVVFSYGIPVTLAMLLGYYLIFLISSQTYSIIRTLVSDSLLWWGLPIVIFALIAIPLYIKGTFDFDALCEYYADFGIALCDWKPLPWIVLIALLGITVGVNRQLQYSHIMAELSKTKVTKLRHVSQFRYLEKYGEIGEYIRLEIKSIMRNKNIKKSFISAIVLATIFSLVCAFTDVYSGNILSNFWCLYCFVVPGAMILTRVMCYEGNYIECLMVQRENILSLLKAKYYLYSSLLVLPFLIMLPTVFTGKWSLLMILGYLFFTSGVQYFFIFQMAVYNKQTIPLNEKFISTSGVESNYFQVACGFVIMIVPMALVGGVQALFNETIAYATLLVLGIIFTLTHRIWLRNVYQRMMARRYKNLEGFRATR